MICRRTCPSRPMIIVVGRPLYANAASFPLGGRDEKPAPRLADSYGHGDREDGQGSEKRKVVVEDPEEGSFHGIGNESGAGLVPRCLGPASEGTPLAVPKRVLAKERPHQARRVD